MSMSSEDDVTEDGPIRSQELELDEEDSRLVPEAGTQEEDQDIAGHPTGISFPEPVETSTQPESPVHLSQFPQTQQETPQIDPTMMQFYEPDLVVDDAAGGSQIGSQSGSQSVITNNTYQGASQSSQFRVPATPLQQLRNAPRSPKLPSTIPESDDQVAVEISEEGISTDGEAESADIPGTKSHSQHHHRYDLLAPHHDIVEQTPDRFSPRSPINHAQVEHSEDMSQASRGRPSGAVASAQSKHSELSEDQGPDLPYLAPGPRNHNHWHVCRLVGSMKESKTVNVIFASSPLESHVIPADRLLELHLERGDKVLVDIQGLRGKVCIVDHLYFQSRPGIDTLSTAEGHNVIRVTPVARSRGQRRIADTCDVLLGQIYMTRTVLGEWIQKYHQSILPAPGMGTPPAGPRSEEDTSGESHRRSRQSLSIYATSPEPSDDDNDYHYTTDGKNTHMAKRLRLDLNYHDSSRTSGKLFQGCLFSISSLDPSETSRISQLISDNGGQVMERGLTEFVTLKNAWAESWDFGEARFAAVVAIRPVRTMKYLEMVACGWPCLNVKYIEACFEEGRVLPIHPYLLSAGRSLTLETKQSQSKIGKGQPGKEKTDDVEEVYVGSDVAQFWDLYIQDQSLNDQFRQRKLILETRTLLCYVDRPPKQNSGLDPEIMKKNLFLLALITRNVVPITSLAMAPEGCIVLDLRDPALDFSPTPTRLLWSMEKYAALPQTLVRGSGWLHECIINGRPV